MTDFVMDEDERQRINGVLIAKLARILGWAWGTE